MHQFGDALSTRSSCEPCVRHGRIAKRRAPVMRQAKSSRKTWPHGGRAGRGLSVPRRIADPVCCGDPPRKAITADTRFGRSPGLSSFDHRKSHAPWRARHVFLHKCGQGRGGLRSGRPPLAFIVSRRPGYRFLAPSATSRAARDRAPRDMANAHFPSPPAWALAIRCHHGTK